MKGSRIFSLKSILVLVMAVVLALLVASTVVWAQPSASPYAKSSPTASPTPASQAVFGQVISTAADQASLVIEKDDGSDVTIPVDSNTVYVVETVDSTTLSDMAGNMEDRMGYGNQMGFGQMPKSSYTPKASSTPGMPDYDRMFGQRARNIQMGSFGDIAAGDLALVRGLSDDNPANVIFIVKFTDNIKYLQGKISSVSDDSVTILPTPGNETTLNIDSQSKLLLIGSGSIKAGQRISLVYDSSTDVIKLALVRNVVEAITTASPSAYSIYTMSKTGLGTYLVDAKGMTLYFTMRDSAEKSVVTGSTLQTWPVFYTPVISGPASLNMSDFGSITRSDGTMQTTFRGYPLYYYANDKAPGDTNGQGIGGVWFIVNPNNFPPTPSATATATP